MRDPNFPETKDVLDRAQRLGTLNQVDRRLQYQGPQCAKPEALLKAVNEQGNHIRSAQKDLGQIRHQVYNLKLRNAIVVSAVTVFLTRSPEIWTWVSRFFR
jgi:hypothetical protein